MTRQIDEKKADAFWTAFVSGENLNRQSPIYCLRERFIKSKSAVAKLPMDIMVALGIKAWNAYRKGETRRSIAYDPSREEFPQFA